MIYESRFNILFLWQMIYDFLSKKESLRCNITLIDLYLLLYILLKNRLYLGRFTRPQFSFLLKLPKLKKMKNSNYNRTSVPALITVIAEPNMNWNYKICSLFCCVELFLLLSVHCCIWCSYYCCSKDIWYNFVTYLIRSITHTHMHVYIHIRTM